MPRVGSSKSRISVPAAILLGAVLAPTDPVLADEVQVGGPVTQGAVEGEIGDHAALRGHGR